MNHYTLSIACLLSLVYIVHCNPRIVGPSHKSDASPPIAELEPLSEQMDPTVQMQSADEDQEKRDWNKLSGVWGKRGWNNLQNMWGKRGWNNLQNMWGKRETMDLPPDSDKRGWNNLSNVWGKRDWNKLSNVWGKRGWNNLSNVWGKRGWNNLSNVWGKRTNGRDDGSKRTTNWNNLKSLWGKRDASWDVPPLWERISPDDESFQSLYVPEQM